MEDNSIFELSTNNAPVNRLTAPLLPVIFPTNFITQQLQV